MPVATPTKQSRRHKKTRRRQSSRPKMTALQARDFMSWSGKSMEQVYAAIEARTEEGIHPDCECEPYDDIFTFGRWVAQGCHVKKGEKSLRIESWVPIEQKAKATAEEATEAAAENSEEGETRPRLKPHTMFLFCRCQVEKDEACK